MMRETATSHLGVWTTKHIEKWAERLQQRVCTEPPVDLNEVCSHLSIPVVHTILPNDIRATWVMTDSPGQRKIIVNSGLSFEQQRFWLAHELGHWVLGRLSTQASDPQCPPSPTGNQVERLCNAFAASLLMPEEWVRRVCEELHHPDRYDKTRTIAGRFLVSEAMMRIRLSELGLAAQRRWARAVERW